MPFGRTGCDSGWYGHCELADPNRPARSGEPVELTVPEIRRLIGALFSPSTTSLSVLLRWSN